MSAPPLLQVTGVSIAFRGNRALDEVSFMVPTGGVTAVIGPNGAGKTTLFNCVTGLYRYSGQVRLDGESLDRLHPAARARRGIARTFQTPALVEHLSVTENVLLGGHVRTRAGAGASMLRLPTVRREERALRADAQVLLERLDLLAVATTPAAELPHGLRRRAEIARALLARPRLLLLDEPAAGVGHVEAQLLGGLLRELSAETGVTFLLVEHNVALVLSVTRHVVVLDFGRGAGRRPTRRHPPGPGRGRRLPRAERVSPLLRLSGVSAYYGDAAALDRIDLDVGEQEMVTLLGANGAGKTTTLRAVSRAVRTTGELRIDDVRGLAALHPRRRPSRGGARAGGSGHVRRAHGGGEPTPGQPGAHP